MYADGAICLDILQNNWSPIYDIAAILTSIQVSSTSIHLRCTVVFLHYLLAYIFCSLKFHFHFLMVIYYSHCCVILTPTPLQIRKLLVYIKKTNESTVGKLKKLLKLAGTHKPTDILVFPVLHPSSDGLRGE